MGTSQSQTTSEIQNLTDNTPVIHNPTLNSQFVVSNKNGVITVDHTQYCFTQYFIYFIFVVFLSLIIFRRDKLFELFNFN